MSDKKSTLKSHNPKKTAALYMPKPIWGVFPVEAQGLSLFRIMLSLVLLYDLFFNILPEWEFIFSADGVLTAHELNRSTIWSFFTYTDHPLFHNILLTLYGVVLCGLLVGYRARSCAFIACIFLTALIDKNPAAHSNAESLAALLLLWAAFLPTTRYWSVEAALNPENTGEIENKDVRRRPWPVIPLLAIKFQIIVIYLHAGLFKLASPAWVSGNAMHDLSFDTAFSTMRMYELMKFIGPDMQYFLVWGVIIFQLCFSLMIYAPFLKNTLRALAILGAAATHLGFLIFLQIHMFPYICFCYLIILIPDSWFDKALKKRREKLSKIRIYYDPDCKFCRATALLFREFCLGATAPVKPSSDDKAAHKLLQKHNSWVVYGLGGQVYLKWRAVSYVMKQSPVFWIFGVLTDLPFTKKPMEKFYTWIGDNRMMLGKLTRPVLKPFPEVYPERVVQYVCLFCLIITFVYTTWALPQITKPISPTLSKTASALHLDQKWNLFVGEWINSDSYDINIRAIDHYNREVNLTPYLDELYQRSSTGHYKFYHHRTMRFILNLFQTDNPRHRLGFVRYLCHKATEDGQVPRTIKLELRQRSNVGIYPPHYIGDAYKCEDVLKTKQILKKIF